MYRTRLDFFFLPLSIKKCRHLERNGWILWNWICSVLIAKFLRPVSKPKILLISLFAPLSCSHLFIHLMLLISLEKLENFLAEFLNYLFVGVPCLPPAPWPGLLESDIRNNTLRIETYNYRNFFCLRFTLKKLI